MEKHLLSKVHQVELENLIESDITLLTSMGGDEQALAELKKKVNYSIMVASYSHQMQANQQSQIMLII